MNRVGLLDAHIKACLAGGRYFVDDAGQIRATSWRGTPLPKVLALRETATGYLRVSLAVAAGQPPRECMAHRVVALARLAEPAQPGMDVNHLNGDKRDNRPANLEWCDRARNMRHSWEIGLRSASGVIGLKGERSCRARLTTSQVREIHRRSARTTQQALADEFGVAQTTISGIIRGAKWPAIYREFNP